jgi:hypothetical protein
MKNRLIENVSMTSNTPSLHEVKLHLCSKKKSKTTPPRWFAAPMCNNGLRKTNHEAISTDQSKVILQLSIFFCGKRLDT